jgi:hypothetical protein
MQKFYLGVLNLYVWDVPEHEQAVLECSFACKGMHVRLAGISKNRDSLQGPLNTKL